MDATCHGNQLWRPMTPRVDGIKPLQEGHLHSEVETVLSLHKMPNFIGQSAVEYKYEDMLCYMASALVNEAISLAHLHRHAQGDVTAPASLAA